MNTTICAPATSLGGAIAVIRVSGSDAIAIINKVFSKDLTEEKGYTVHFGQIINTDNRKEIIDEVLVTLFRAPHSYTGEDCIEISCHASRYIVQKICALLIANGCESAKAGEFTKRAFLNGKMDLSQAEAVADLIAAENRASHDIAMGQMKGNFSTELGKLREQLLKLTSLLELELDFSEHEDLTFADRTELKQLASTIDKRIMTLAESFLTGQAIKNGIPVAIVGKTNVGKSTLLNRLLHEEKAIVSDIHGTTRDVIEDVTLINSLTFRFIDTAGIRDTNDEIELLGIERTYKKLQEAQIILWMIDSTPTKKELDEILSLTDYKSIIVVCNKIDKENSLHQYIQSIPSNIQVISISAKYGTNIPQLESAIYYAANIPEIHANDIIVTNSRHYDALTRAHSNLQNVFNAFQTNLSSELIAEDLRTVLSDLADITGGQITNQETLTNIFSHFCVGK